VGGLVVEQLLIAVQDDPRLEAVWRAFNSLPAGLEELYDAIQSSLDRGQRQAASKLYQLVFEWKRVWSSHISATYIWLAVNFQDTEALVYPSAAEEAGIAQVLARLLVGITRGLLQLSSSSSSPSSSTRQVELLHRTVYDWMRMEDNWSTIIAGEPGGFNPTHCLIAVLVCHFQSGRMGISTRKLETTLYRILRLANRVENTAENRARLMKILDKLDPLSNASLRVINRIVPADCGGYWPGMSSWRHSGRASPTSKRGSRPTNETRSISPVSLPRVGSHDFPTLRCESFFHVPPTPSVTGC